MPDKVVQIEGVGNVAFPTGMSDMDIQKAIETDIIPRKSALPPSKLEAGGPSMWQRLKGALTIPKAYDGTLDHPGTSVMDKGKTLGEGLLLSAPAALTGGELAGSMAEQGLMRGALSVGKNVITRGVGSLAGMRAGKYLTEPLDKYTGGTASKVGEIGGMILGGASPELIKGGIRGMTSILAHPSAGEVPHPSLPIEPDVMVVPEPRLSSGPNLMGSVPRTELPDLAARSTPYAADQLASLGKPTLVTPSGSGYPASRIDKLRRIAAGIKRPEIE